MKVVAIIQARMGSNRLPGKVLADVAGRPMLERVIRRVERAEWVDEVVVATSTKAGDDEVVTACEYWGVNYWRGSEQDVLSRFYAAARAYGAEVVVRITADCPLIDPDVIDRVVGAFMVGAVDYASTALERRYPRGLDAEVMSMAGLGRVWAEAKADYERVHVTPYFYQHPELFSLLAVTKEGADLSEWRWTVDTAEDLAFIRAVYEHFEGEDDMGWEAVVDLLKAKPELRQINAHIEQKGLHEG